MILQKVLSSK